MSLVAGKVTTGLRNNSTDLLNQWFREITTQSHHITRTPLFLLGQLPALQPPRLPPDSVILFFFSSPHSSKHPRPAVPAGQRFRVQAPTALLLFMLYSVDAATLLEDFMSFLNRAWDVSPAPPRSGLQIDFVSALQECEASEISSRPYTFLFLNEE